MKNQAWVDRIQAASKAEGGCPVEIVEEHDLELEDQPDWWRRWYTTCYGRIWGMHAPTKYGQMLNIGDKDVLAFLHGLAEEPSTEDLAELAAVI